jgi:O-antigen/teichoic acid export membrane protein
MLWLLFSWFKLLKALVYGDLIGRVVLLGFSVWQSFLNGFDIYKLKLKSLKKMLLLYKDYPLYNTIPSLLNTASLMLPLLFINKFYTLSNTSNFGLTIQVLSLPLALISVAVSQVLLQKVTEFKNKGENISGFIFSLLKKLILLSIIGIVVVQLASKPLFEFIYGKEYIQAGEFALIIIFASALKFIVSPLSVVFPALDRIKVSSIWQIIYFILILSLIFFTDLSIKDFLIVYVFIDIIAYSIHALFIFFVIKKYDTSLLNK